VSDGFADAGAPPTWRGKLPWLALAVVALATDLTTKWLVFYPDVLDPSVRERIAAGRSTYVVCEIASWWNVILVYNTGVTFGSLEGAATWLLSLLTGGVIVFLFVWLWRTPQHERVKLYALSIIVGGAVGNLYDRTLRTVLEPDRTPGVRDFLDWHLPEGWPLHDWLKAKFTTHWYTSNVADVCIVVGVSLLAICILFEKPAPDGARAGGGEVT
jgi:signal peptidase II